MKTYSNAMLRMLKARSRVAEKNVFYASILYHARMIESKAQDKMTWTNGINVFFNPDHVDNPENDQFVEGNLLFQTMRCAFNHLPRKQTRDLKLWNVASEYALTHIVKQVYPMPPDALESPQVRKLTTEEIYRLVEQQNPPPPPSGSGGKGPKGKRQQQQQPPQPGMGEMQEPDPDETPEEGGGDLDEAAEDWARATKVAADKAEKAGRLPGYLKTLIEELYPKDNIDWRLLMDDMIRESKTNVNVDWARPNRRFAGSGLILPGKGVDKVFRVVLCLDVSGSVNDTQKKEMKAEAMSLLDQQLVTNVTLISTDTRICNMADVSTAEEVQNFDFGPHGGGTDFRTAMKTVADIEDAVGCVFFTDMETMDFGQQPDIPVIWVNWTASNAIAPYGQTTHYK